MSWSYQGAGKPAALKANALDQLGKITCTEPEQTIKAKVMEIIAAALDAMPENGAVKINAMGSQSSYHGGAAGAQTDKFSNSVTLQIEPLWNFIE